MAAAAILNMEIEAYFNMYRPIITLSVKVITVHADIDT